MNKISGSSRQRSQACLCLESLEDRCLLSGNVLQTNLVSDVPGVARVVDPNLVNPWGIAASPTGPFWIADNNAGLSTVYNTPGMPQAPAVSIPAPGSAGGTVAPTGADFNIVMASQGFLISDGTHTAPAIFLFATTAGTIAGWNPSVDPTGEFDGHGGASTYADIAVDNSASAVYKGLTIATDAANQTFLYATNFYSGRIDVFDTSFHAVANLPAGAFTDAALPAGYVPFNIQASGDQIYVTYARQDYGAGPGHGFIDVFNLDGSGGHRLVSGGPLDLPWGLALAPTGFGSFGGDLLVGNFGNGLINAFDPQSGKYAGTLTDPSGEAIQIDGLWALHAGNGYKGGDTDTVYFTAGIDDEAHGLFGSLTAAPQEPASTPVPVTSPSSVGDNYPLDESLAAPGAAASPGTGTYLSGAYGEESSSTAAGGYSYVASVQTYDATTYDSTPQAGASESREYQVAPEAKSPVPVAETTNVPGPQPANLPHGPASLAPVSGAAVGALVNVVASLATHPAPVAEARVSADGASSGAEQVQTALESGSDKIVEQLAASPDFSADGVHAALQMDNLLGGGFYPSIWPISKGPSITSSRAWMNWPKT